MTPRKIPVPAMFSKSYFFPAQGFKTWHQHYLIKDNRHFGHEQLSTVSKTSSAVFNLPSSTFDLAEILSLG